MLASVNPAKAHVSLEREQVIVNLLTDFYLDTLTACHGFDIVQQLSTELVNFIKQLCYLGSHHVLKLTIIIIPTRIYWKSREFYV